MSENYKQIVHCVAPFSSMVIMQSYRVCTKIISFIVKLKKIGIKFYDK